MLTRYPLRRGTTRPVLVEYVDGQGERSMRQVSPIAIVQEPTKPAATTTYLLARCSIAKGLRTFRADRIASLNDPRTGEELDVRQWFDDQDLGVGAPFDWSETEPTREHPIDEPTISASRPTAWRAVLTTTIFGYIVGRWRLIPLVLLHFKVHHGLWL